MKKLLLSFIFLVTISFIHAQTPYLYVEIDDASMLTTMKPTDAPIKVKRVFGSNLQSTYRFVNGVPQSPLSPFLASLHLNIISTYPGVTGFWSTEKVYSSEVNTIIFTRSINSFYTQSMQNKEDSTRIAVDSTNLKNNYYTKTIGDARFQPIGSYLTSENDPTVPSYSKGLTSFGIIKASTDPLYKPLTYVPTNAEVISAIGYTPYNATNPNGYISSYTETDPVWNAQKSSYSTTAIANGLYYPISGNPSSFVTSSSLSTTLGGYATTSALTSGLATKEPTITAGTTLQYWRGDKTWQTLPTPNVYTAGTGIGVASNVITNTAPDQVVSLSGANGLGVTGTYPSFTLTQYVPTINSGVVRPVNGTTFTISTTKPARVNYSITIACTATIGSAAAADVTFQYSVNGGTSWISTAGKVENSNTVTLAVVLQSVNKQTSSVIAEVPANALCRLVSTTSGVNAVITYNTGVETY